jgi:hypothetical protein
MSTDTDVIIESFDVMDSEAIDVLNVIIEATYGM